MPHASGKTSDVTRSSIDDERTVPVLRRLLRTMRRAALEMAEGA
jgi:hypothetical protein